MQMLARKQKSRREFEDGEFKSELQLRNDESLFSFGWCELYYNVINQISLGWLHSRMKMFLKTYVLSQFQNTGF